jgi:hypothetical protein
MQRISTATRFQDKFGPGKDGFRDGDPGLGTASTQLEALWFDNAQEEIANAIELSGLPLNPNDMTQLWQAIRNGGGLGPFVRITGDTMTGPLVGTQALFSTVQAVNVSAYSATGIYSDSNIFFGAAPTNHWVLSTNAAGSMFLGFQAGGPVTNGLVIDPGGNAQLFGITTFAGTDMSISYGGTPGVDAFRQWRWTGNAVDVFYDQTGLRSWNNTFGTALMTLSNAGYLNLNGDMQVSGAIGIQYIQDANHFAMSWDGTLVHFFVNGNDVNTGNPSDARIKDVTGDYTRGLTEVLALTPITFRFKGNDTTPSEITGMAADAPPFRDLEREHVSLIAQDIEAIIPEMIVRSKGYVDGVAVDDLRSLNPMPLTLALVNAVKEIAARLDAIEGSALARPIGGLSR